MLFWPIVEITYLDKYAADETFEKACFIDHEICKHWLTNHARCHNFDFPTQVLLFKMRRHYTINASYVNRLQVVANLSLIPGKDSRK